MIRLSKFEFYAPSSLTESLEILAQGNGDMKILAGGTDLIIGMKQGIVAPKHVLWLGKLEELQQVTFSPGGGLRIGAMCTLDEIGRNEDVRRYYPSLVQAVRSIASPQIRNRATIGGNLCLNTRCYYYDQSEFWRSSLGYCLKYGDGICHAAPGLSRCAAVCCSDLAPLLIALDATVELCSASARRLLPLSRFYHVERSATSLRSSDGKHHLTAAPSEILTSVTIPYDPRVKSAHGKMRARASIDFAIANTGVAVKLNDKGECEHARIVVGAISSSPVEAAEPARRMIGRQLTAEKIVEAAREVAEVMSPLPNLDGAVLYRKKMVAVLVKRALHHALNLSQP